MFAAVVIVSGGLLFWLWPGSRANVVTTVWGGAGVAVVLWWILEQSSEAVQRRVWLRRNAVYLRPVLETFVNTSAVAAAFAVGLSNRVQSGIREGSLAARAPLIAEAQQHVTDFAEDRLPEAAQKAERAHLLTEDVRLFARGIQEAADQNAGLLARCPEVLGSVQQYLVACRMFLGSPAAHPEAGGEYGPIFARFLLAQIGGSALALCDPSSRVLCEAGVVGSRVAATRRRPGSEPRHRSRRCSGSSLPAATGFPTKRYAGPGLPTSGRYSAGRTVVFRAATMTSFATLRARVLHSMRSVPLAR